MHTAAYVKRKRTCRHLLSTCRKVCAFNGTEEKMEADCHWCGQPPDSEHNKRQELGCQQHVPHHCQTCTKQRVSAQLDNAGDVMTTERTSSVH